jgi:hypothetical protein
MGGLFLSSKCITEINIKFKSPSWHHKKLVQSYPDYAKLLAHNFQQPTTVL